MVIGISVKPQKGIQVQQFSPNIFPFLLKKIFPNMSTPMKGEFSQWSFKNSS